MSILDQPVNQCCTKDVVTVTLETPVSAAVELMSKMNITSVLVCKERIPTGIITSRDLPKLFDSYARLSDTPVNRLMTSPIDRCGEEDTVLDALDMMINNGYRHLPVVDAHNNLTGIISETDIMNSLGFYDPTQHRQIEEVMDHTLSEIDTSTTLAQVMTLFRNKRTECLVVSENSVPQGIVTERDLSGLLASGLASHTPAKEFMSNPAITVSVKSSVQGAINLMNDSKVHHLIAVDQDGNIRGVISRNSFLPDLTRFLIRQLVKSEKLIMQLQGEV